MARGRHRRALIAAALVLCAAAVGAAVTTLHHHGRPRAAAPPMHRHRRPSRPRPRPRLVAGPHDASVPILMYHVIAVPPSTAPFPELFVRPRDFAGQARWLARHGYHAVTLRQVYDYWRSGYALPRRPVVLSFDDGYLGDDTHVRPVLAALHWSGVLNLEVRNFETVGDLPVWRVQRLIHAGWEIDAHTITHPDLTTVDATRLWHEVAGSRALIRRTFGVPVDFFCYPSGRYDAKVIAVVRRAGYLGATTTNYGLAKPPGFFTLNRVRINLSDGVRGFAEKLTALSRAPGSG